MVHMDHVVKERKSYNRVVEISREKKQSLNVYGEGPWLPPKFIYLMNGSWVSKKKRVLEIICVYLKS